MGKPLTHQDICNTVNVMPFGQHGSAIRPYLAFYLASPFLAQHNITVAPEDIRRPILFLAGTGLSMADRLDLVTAIAEAGLEVASIENALGGLLDIDIDPVTDRPDSLRDFLRYMRESGNVCGIDILAQSYSAFEVIRVLQEDPVGHRPFVKSVTFINLPGMNEHTGVFSHSVRFLFHHIMKGYLRAIRFLSKSGRTQPEAMKQVSYYRAEIYGMKTWSKRTFANPVRTIRELRDIVTFRIRKPLVILQNEYGYDLNFFLQSGDQLLPVDITLQQLSGVVAAERIRVVPGSHNDLYFQQWQRGTLIDFLRVVRSRSLVIGISEKSPQTGHPHVP